MKQFILDLPLEQQILFALLLFIMLVQCVYYFAIYLKPVIWKRKDENPKTEPISVIICARNEYDNLQANLPKVLSQNYDTFEVIVVNDCSGDDSDMLLAEMELKYKHLRHTTIQQDKKFYHGKKLAITIGMKSAKYSRLVFIDADCYPASNQWLAEMSKSYTPDKQIVLGYGGYEKAKGLLNKIIRFDTTFIAMQYFGLALAGRPYMGVGRNLSYLKQLFFGGTGFSKHYQLLSGDDDLFVNENSNKTNTACVITKDSFTVSKPQTTWQGWAKQKKRHLTTGKYYKKTDKLILATELFSRMLFYALIATLLILKANIIIIASTFVFRLLVQLTIFKLNMNKFGEKGFLLLLPIVDILLPVIHLIFIISNKINSRKNKWK